MTGNTQKNILKKLLLRTQGKARLRVALVVLCVGTTLLLISVLTWWNFTLLLRGNEGNGVSSYIVIGKEITDRNMAASATNTFSAQEVSALHSAPQVQDVGEVTPARFPVYATIGGKLAMATDLPLESVPDRFIDNLPGDWDWQPGNRDLPVILSTQFLDVYNYVFAPGQGLPQLSRASVKSIALRLQAGGERGLTFSAHVSGFSDRIGSVLAPQSFIEYGNKAFAAQDGPASPSQLILKVKDPSDKTFTDYLQQHGYAANPQNLRWSKMRAIVEAVTGATGILALLLIGISALVFVLFIELTITRAQDSLVLLAQLGYSPRGLRRFMIKHFLPMVCIAMVLSLTICIGVQYAVASKARAGGLSLPSLPGLPVWVAFIACTGLLLLLVMRSVRKAMKG